VSGFPRAPVVFLVDVDNTLLDNDLVSADLLRHLDLAMGPEGRARVLTVVKRSWGARVTTVFPRQGHYAHDPEALATNPAADLTVERIGDLVDHDLSTARARAAAAAS
jgi:hypothetical protein